MAQVFNLGNALQAGDQLRSNELRLSGERQRQDIQQREFDADQQQANTFKLLNGIRIAQQNPNLLPQVGQQLVADGILNEAELPALLQRAQTDPAAFMQQLEDFESQLMFALSEAPSQPTFGAPVAGQDIEGNALFRRFSPTGESKDVEGFAPLAGAAAGASGRERFFGSLTEGLSSEEQEQARRIQLGLDPRAVGSANITIAGDEGLTEDVAESQATIVQRKKFAEATGALRSKLIDKGFESIKSIDANLRNIDKAIAAIDEGAITGVIESKFFPTIRKSTVKLNQIQSELGLDVVGGVTFGALSKGELDLALTVALPIGLQPPELRQWLQAKKTAQEKLRAYYAEQIDFLDKGGSIAGFLRSKQRQGGNNEQLIQQAKDAIAQGADRNAVIQRLADAGVDASGL